MMFCVIEFITTSAGFHANTHEAQNPPLLASFVQTTTLELVPVYDRMGIPTEKTFFLVRHGESMWNQAQTDRDLVGMMSQKDHPLNETGVAQAEALRDRLISAYEGDVRVLSDAEQEFLDADSVMSSPLCRAVQTAVIACSPLLKRLRRRLTLVSPRTESTHFPSLWHSHYLFLAT